MKIQTLVNDLELDDTTHPKGALVDVDDEVGKGLVQRGLALEVKGRKAPESRGKTTPGKPEESDPK